MFCNHVLFRASGEATYQTALLLYKPDTDTGRAFCGMQVVTSRRNAGGSPWAGRRRFTAERLPLFLVAISLWNIELSAVAPRRKMYFKHFKGLEERHTFIICQHALFVSVSLSGLSARQRIHFGLPVHRFSSTCTCIRQMPIHSDLSPLAERVSLAVREEEADP